MFPLDRWWRQKHQIAFNSLKHREVSYIDIVLEYIEDSMFKQFNDEYRLQQEKQELFKKGIVIQQSKEEQAKEEDDLFEKLKINIQNG